MAKLVFTTELKESDFPRAMTLTHEGGVFLFLSKNKAVCLSPGNCDDWKTGECYDDTNINAFTDYNEPITIQNA